jgi:hypothetical protein
MQAPLRMIQEMPPSPHSKANSYGLRNPGDGACRTYQSPHFLSFLPNLSDELRLLDNIFFRFVTCIRSNVGHRCRQKFGVRFTPSTRGFCNLCKQKRVRQPMQTNTVGRQELANSIDFVYTTLCNWVDPC